MFMRESGYIANPLRPHRRASYIIPDEVVVGWIIPIAPERFQHQPNLVVDLPTDEEIFLPGAGVDGNNGLLPGIQGFRLFGCQLNHGILPFAPSYGQGWTSDKTTLEQQEIRTKSTLLARTARRFHSKAQGREAHPGEEAMPAMKKP
jgi:hypothetical protein